MPLFRFHRGSLKESLKTTVIVKNKSELINVILKGNLFNIPKLEIKQYIDFSIEICLPYELTIEQSFDPRCGWYTHYVSINIGEKEKFFMVGMLSEPLEE